MGGQAGGVRHGVAGERSSRGFIWSDRKHRRFTAERGADFMDNASYQRAEESRIEQGPIAAPRGERVGGWGEGRVGESPGAARTKGRGHAY